jgi:hypothetical protein
MRCFHSTHWGEFAINMRSINMRDLFEVVPVSAQGQQYQQPDAHGQRFPQSRLHALNMGGGEAEGREVSLNASTNAWQQVSGSTTFYFIFFYAKTILLK